MNNEPVAWMETYCGEPNNLVWLKEEAETIHPYGVIPLYTHPHSAESVKVKEQDESFDRTASHMAGEYVSYKDLTDSEIQEISHRYHYTYNPDYIGFARAILRKAQEKC